MRKIILVAVLLFGLFVVIAFAQTVTESENKPQLHWIKGPAAIKLGDVARINLPAGYSFVEKKDIKALYGMTHNVEIGDELGAVFADKSNWFMVFRYVNTGHIMDDEKFSLDPDELFNQIKAATQDENKERIKRGWVKATIIGWEVRPHYNDKTNNLEFAYQAIINDVTCVNYKVMLLGREGIVIVNGVFLPASVHDSLIGMRAIIANFSFNQGQKYSEYRQGGKLAVYGLVALVAGGAATVAFKSGLVKWLGTAILAALVVAAAYIWSLFKRKK